MTLLKTKPLGSLQLHKAKQQIKGQLAMSEENNNALMLMMAKSLLDLERVPNLSDLFEAIDIITASDLQEMANQTLDWEKMSQLTFHAE